MSSVFDRSREPLERSGPYLAAGLGFLVAFALVYAAAVLTETGQRLENTGLLGAEIRSQLDRGQSVGALSPISVLSFGFVLVGVVLVGLARRRPGLGVVAAVTMVAAVAAAEVLKDVLPRPPLVTGPSWLLRNSFPSGTAAVAAAMTIGSLIVAPDRLRWAVLIAGAIGAGVIAQATQVAGWHRLSDVVGSTFLVAACGCFGVGSVAAVGLVAPSTVGRIHARLYGALLLGAAGLLGIGSLLLAILIVFPILGSPEGSRRAFFQTVFPLFGAATTVLSLLLFARLIEQRTFGRRPGPVREAERPANGDTPDGDTPDRDRSLDRARGPTAR